MKYKTIFFDWHETLSQSLFWDQLKDSGHPRHLWHEPMFRCLMIEHRPMVFEWMRGRKTMHDVVELLSEQCGYLRELILADLRESCETMRLVSDEVLPLVARLRAQGVRCVIATDNMDTFTEFTVPALGLRDHFDDFLNSFDLRTLKQDLDPSRPGIPFFEEYLMANGQRYGDAVLIDDSEYGEAYSRAGLDVIRVSQPEDVVTILRGFVEEEFS